MRVIRDILGKSKPDFGTAADALLDVGCGDCYVMGELARSYPRARFVGVDAALTPELLEIINGRHPNARAQSGFENLHGKFNAVLMLDVLEHIVDDSGFLRGMGARPELAGAEFFITVPAFHRLFSHHDRFLDHRRRYSLTRLKEMVSGAGFAVSQSGYFFLTLLPFRIVQMLLDSIRTYNPEKIRGVAELKSDFIDGLIGMILYADYKATRFLNKLGLTLPGLSCFVVCKKL